MEGDIEYLQRRVNEERRQTSYGPALPVDWAAVAALLKEVERLREIEANVDRVTAEWSRRCQELEEENNRLRGLLKQALRHVEDAGDDTLAAIIDTQIGSDTGE